MTAGGRERRGGPRRRIGSHHYAPDGFAVLRIPLLPMTTYLAWNEAAPASAPLLERRRILRRALAAVFRRPVVREALYLASPDLHDRLDAWLADPDAGDPQVELALIRYFQRLTCRATPFGLFASCSMVPLGHDQRLELAGPEGLRRVSRLDMDYLQSLVDALTADAAIRRHLRFVPNDSLYRAGGRLRYVESRVGSGGRSHHLVTVGPDPFLEAAIDAARDGATRAGIAAAVAALDPDVTTVEAEAYVDELVEGGVLVPESGLPVTGEEPLSRLLDRLASVPPAAPVVAGLREARERLARLDRTGPGNPPAAYDRIADRLRELPVPVRRQRLVQVDLWRAAAPDAVLSERVAAAVLRGVALLQRLAPPTDPSPLDDFRRAFRERYEDREVPLTEVLDEDMGIGFLRSGRPAAGGSPLLAGLPLGGGGRLSGQAPPPHPLASLLLERYHACVAAGGREIALTDDDLKRLGAPDPAPLPDAFAAFVAVIGPPGAEPGRDGAVRVFLRGVSGPSGARLLGRFCHLSPELTAAVREHLRREEALRPDAVFAEVVHLPEGRVGNILFRPLLREYEIPYLGTPGVPPERCLPLQDLLVSVRGDRVVLRSRRLGREIVPRLTTAHNYMGRTTGPYRLLGLLQGQESRLVPAWSWGPLEGAPFLPRVRYGDVVLAPARWRVSVDTARAWAGTEDAERRFAAVRGWVEERRLPRLVEVAENDNTLTVDLENPLAVDAMVDLLSRHRGGEVREVLEASPDLLAATANGEAYRHELIIPFTRLAEAPAIRREGNGPADTAREASSDDASAPAMPALVRHVPGGEWLYARLYCGEAAADTLLRDHVAPLVASLEEAGLVDRWFFIRYGDPDWHVRLRLHGRPANLAAEVLPALHESCREPLATGLLWRVVLDTYVPEVGRYGGPEVLPVCEELFHHDSRTVLSLLPLLEGDTGHEARWLLALLGTHLLLAEMGLEPARALPLVTSLRDGYVREFGGGKSLKRALGRLHRDRRALVAWLLDGEGERPADDLAERLVAGRKILAARSVEWREDITRLLRLVTMRRSTAPVEAIAGSLAHMHANRLLRSGARAHEMVIDEFLARTYRARLARCRV